MLCGSNLTREPKTSYCLIGASGPGLQSMVPCLGDAPFVVGSKEVFSENNTGATAFARIKVSK